MTSNDNGYRQEEYGRRNQTDGYTSDDALLLMADDADDKTPLLNINDTASPIADDDLTSRSRALTQSIHCHVPDDKFDFGARNRLILVLFICIIFMCIEIVGTVLHKR